MRPYVIYTYEWYRASGGIKVLYKLCHDLNQRGMEAYVMHQCKNDEWYAPQIPDDTTRERIRESGIAIYPEIVIGNPLGTPKRVRWVLNYPGLLGGVSEYDPDELVFTFYPFFMPSEKTLGNLSISYYEDFLNQLNLPQKEGAVFWNGKGWRTPRIPLTENMPEITAIWPSERRELAEVLRKCEYFVSYDNMTGLIEESRLCGTPVFIVKDPNVNYETNKLGEYGTVGVFYDMNDLEKAKEEVKRFPELHRQRVEREKEELTKFIEITQNV